ncbi:MAG: DNRLRE domain-containing protein [Gemmatimonadota bacterium]|nr:DNRLRE domain-containing protein [Gemmatimonadota bacterium]
MRVPRFPPLTLFAVVLVGCAEVAGPQGERRTGWPAPRLPSASIAPVEHTIPVSADTYLKQGSPNKNQGSEAFLRIRQSGKNRALVHWDQAAMQTAVGDGYLLSARLELEISDNGNNWGTTGRPIAVHLMTQSWTEVGATWNCADDVDTSNQAPDCAGDEWEMGKPNQPELHPWVAEATDEAVIEKFQTGVVEFDVTDDLRGFLDGTVENHGWLIRKVNEGQSGRIEFHSGETASPPRLVLEVEPQAAWCNTTLDFDGGLLPTGWQLDLIRNGPGLVNDRLEGRPIDSGARIFHPDSPHSGTTEIELNYEFLHSPTSSAISGLTILPVQADTSFTINGFNGGSTRIPGHLYFRASKDRLIWPADTDHQQQFEEHVPFSYGLLDYTIVIRDGSIDMTAREQDGTVVFTLTDQPLSGFQVQALQGFYFAVYTTTTAMTYVDDLSITCR